jgi:heterotetrameric sarcosine oxidase gamma subunit
VSAPESSLGRAVPAGIVLRTCAADVIEIAALRGATGAPARLTATLEPRLPACGRIAPRAAGLALAVRPERWLLLSAPTAPGAAVATWQSAVRGTAAVVDLSSALTALHLAGAAVREMLARGCRLDLHPGVFAPGAAAATVIAQVAVIVAALPAAMLLLTPASTAHYFREWLAATGRPFGLVTGPGVTVASVSEIPA